MTKSHFAPVHNDMARHMMSGVLNSGALQMVKLLCQIGSVVIVSRLLSPADFGVLGMVGPVYSFVILFQQLGLSQATVQKASLGHDDVNALFWVNVGVALVLSTLLVIFSPVVGWFYNDPRLVPLTVAMGAFVLVGALGNQHCALLQRRMAFGSLAVIDMLATVGALTTTIIASLLLNNYWALYLGMIAGTLIPVVGVWVASDWRPSFPRSFSGLRDMLHFGAGVTGYNFMEYLVRNLDSVLIGRTWGSAALGLYDRAYKLLLFPLQRFAWPLGGVMIPILSHLKDDPDIYRHTALNALRQLTLAIWPGILWALVFSDTLIPTLLGPNWATSAPIFRPLAIAALLQILTTPTSWLFISQGRTTDYARWGFVYAVTGVLSFIIGLPYGAVGVAAAYAAGEALRAPFVWWYVTRRGPVRFSEVALAVGPQTAASFGAVLILLAFRHFRGDTSPWGLLIEGAALSYAATAIAMMLLPSGRETLRQTLTFARRLLRHLSKRPAAPETAQNGNDNQT